MFEKTNGTTIEEHLPNTPKPTSQANGSVHNGFKTPNPIVVCRGGIDEWHKTVGQIQDRCDLSGLTRDTIEYRGASTGFESPHEPHGHRAVYVPDSAQTAIRELVAQHRYSVESVVLVVVHQLLKQFGNGSHTVVGLIEHSRCSTGSSNDDAWELIPSLMDHQKAFLVEEALSDIDHCLAPKSFDKVDGAAFVAGIPSGLCNMIVVLADEETDPIQVDGPCHITVYQQKDAIQMSVHFATSIFTDETVGLFTEALRVLLCAVGTTPKARLDEIELLSSSQLKQLEVWNNTDGEYPSSKRLHHLVEKTVERCGDRTAIVYGDRRLSYHDMNAQANRLARYLCGRGIQPEQLIALLVDKSELLIITILAVWKSGAAYATIDPAYPDERARFVLEDTKTQVVIASRKHVRRLCQSILPSDDTLIMTLESMLEALGQNKSPEAESNLDNLSLTSRQLAYITYTSGTTGQPKGIFKEHTNVVNSITDLSLQYGVAGEKNEAILLFSAYVFEPFIRQVLMALVTGARLVIINDEDKYDPARLIPLIQEQQITYLHGTASVLQEFDFSACHSLRRVILVGESLTDSRYQALRRQFTQPILSEYGFTESAFVTALNILDPGAPGPDSCIGRPVRNVKCYILNSALRRVPIGATGELHVGGLGISRGYMNRPELTKQRFLPNPFQNDDERRRGVNGRLYKTGDLARWLPSGKIQYLGRADFQIKLRGIRIEPGEIESSLLRFPGIRTCLVVSRRLRSGPGEMDETEQEHLVGYCVPERPGIAESDMLSFAEKILPRYMVPTRLVELAQIPTTINGKADLRALPVPTLNALPRGGVEVVLDQTESQVRRIWSTVLGIDEKHIVPDDSFFRLGGHSITCIQLMARVREQTGITITVEDVFAQRTLASMAQLVRDRQSRPQNSFELPNGSAPLALPADAPVDGSIEASFLANSLQQGFFYHYLKTNGDSKAYVMQSLIQYNNKIDAEVYHLAWKDAQTRFPALRLRFLWKEDAFQIIDRDQPLDWRYRELKSETGSECQFLNDLQFHDREESYQLESGFLFRVYFIQHPGNSQSWCLFSCHHAVLDGWSLPLLFEHVHEAYLRARAGKELPPWTDSAYLGSQRYLQAHRDDHLAHWASVIEPVTERCDLNPLLNESSRYKVPLAEYDEIQDQREKTMVVEPAEWLSQLRRECAADGLTLHSLLQFVWHRVLHTYGNGSHTITGTTIAGRQLPVPGIEDSVGMYINSLPLVIAHNSEDNPSVRQAVADVQSRVNAMNSRGAVVLGRICNSRLKHGLFDTLFVLENYPARDSSRAQGHREALQYDIRGGIEKLDYPLAVVARESNAEFQHKGDNASLTITICYAGELISDETIDELLALVRDTLHKVAHHLDQPVQSLERLSSNQLNQLATWNSTQANFPWSTLHELFTLEAHRKPHKTAVVTETVSLTYAELNHRVNRMAHQLQTELALQPNQLVALVLDKSEHMIVSILAVWKTGAAYVPVDAIFPDDRIRYILEDTAARAVVADTIHLNRVRKLVPAGFPVYPSDLSMHPGPWSECNLTSSCTPTDLAYIMYTSGTTGRPKGVMVEHHGVVSLQVSLSRIFGLRDTDDEVILSFSNYIFDHFVEQFTDALLNGQTLLVLDDVMRGDKERLYRYIERNRVTYLSGTPSVVSMYEFGRFSEHLRRIDCVGEAFSEPVFDQIRSTFSGLIINGYGPTEVSITTHKRLYFFPERRKDKSIGCQVHNSTTYVLDDKMQRVPIGAVGELYLGGQGVARGYHNRPDLTQERFPQNPFQTEGERRSGRNGRLYRTGDLVRWIPGTKGEIEYLGRNDFQVKVRGVRIELGEIEGVLSTYPDIRHSVVLARPRNDTPEKLFLVGYYVADTVLPPSAIRRFMQSRLPDYMVPSRLMAIDHIPVTPSGKLDSKALPIIEQEQEDDVIAQPRSEIERELRDIWASLLEIPSESISISADFFGLGGDSLRITKLSFLVGDRLGRQIAVSKLFQFRTVEAQARFLVHSSASIDEIQPMDGSAAQPCPVSPAQERLLFLRELEEGAADAYNISMTLKLSGPWDAAAIELALFAMVARHEALRTLLAKDEKTGSYLQKIMPVESVSAQLAMARITVATQLELDEEIARRAQHLFKLADELPFHACLLHMASSQDLYVTFVVHHAVFDAWSWSIFQRDFLACAGRSHGFSVASNLHPLRIQYKEYAQHHRARLTAARRQALCGWWQDRLESLMPTDLVTDYPRPPSFNHTGDDVSVLLDSGITKNLQELARCCRASVYALMLSVFALMLATYTGQPDVAVGIPQTHRTHPEFESVIGFFVNLLVLRVDTRQSSVRALIIHVMQGLVDAQLHQDLPFQELPRLLGIERDPSRHPVVQTVFNYEAFQEADASPTALQMSDYSPRPDVMGSVAKFDLNATVRETSEGLDVNFNYASTLFERQTVQQWLRSYQYLLQQIALPAVSDMPIDQLSWSPDANAVPHIPLPLAAEPEPRQGGCETPNQMFEREALRIPNLTAVVDGSRALSYEELDLQTNQLARYMCSVASLKPDSRVALILDKSLEMIIAILAVWKAGAAYVPLDPAGPPGRINHIIKESSPRLVIGHDKFVSPLSCGCPVVGLDSVVAQDAVRQQPTGPVMSETRSHHLAYIIFTSGTTGQPKGVLVENGGVSQFAYAARRRYFGRASDFQHGVLFLSHYTFDFSVEQLALSVLSGHKLLIPPVDFAARPEFYHQANLNGLTYLSGTPSLLQNIDVGNLQSLRVITAAGEQFLPAQYEKLRKMFAGPIYNAYGITETTVYNIVSEFGPQDSFENALCFMLPGTRAYILTEQLRPLQIGAVGELYLAGDCLSRGYLNQPDLTAESFPVNPFCTIDEKSGGCFSRLYRTGDLVRCRMSTDGIPRLEYLGRRDNQIKLRGFRIELRELESVLRSCPGLKDAAIIPQFDYQDARTRIARSLVAYYSVEPGQEVAENSLLSYLRRQVPAYMIPRRFHRLHGPLPVTVNGKLDTRQLPDISSKLDTASGYFPPRDWLDRRLCRIWADVLDSEECGIDDHLLQVGGDSITALQLVAQIHTQLGHQVTVRQIFDMPTVRALRDGLGQSEGNELLQYSTEQGLVEGEAPLLPIQEWLLSKPLENRNYWNHAFSIRTPALDMTRLSAAIKELQHHHDAFRTRICPNGKFFVQKFVPECDDAPLHVVDVNTSPASRVSQLLIQWQSEFDLTHGPLATFAYLHSPTDSTAHIWIAAHHAIIDTVSWQILARDLETLYRGGNLGPKGSSVRQWAHAMHDYSPVIAEKLYWESLVAKVPSSALPSSTGYRMKQSLRVSMDESATLLQRLNTSRSIRIDDVLLAAVGLAVQRHMPSKDPTMITLEGHGREDDIDARLDVSRTMGWFTSMFPFQIPQIDDSDLLGSASEVRQQRNQVAHHGATYGAIYGYVHYPLPALSFNYLGRIGSVGDSSREWALDLDHHGFEWGLCTSPADKGKSDSLLDITAACVDGAIRVDMDSALSQHVFEQVCSSIEETLSQVAAQLDAQHMRMPPKAHNRLFSETPFTPYFDYRDDSRSGSILFLFPPGEGGAESYFNNIIPSLSHRNIVAFNNVYLHNKSRLTFEDLAELYERWVCELQPQGPYHFLGWSFGGTLALEISRRLVSRGDRVSLLALLDTYFDVRGATQSIGLGESHILDPIHHIYDPEPTRFRDLLSATDHLVLFKAMKPNDHYESEDQRRLYEHYDQTPVNHMDTWVPRDCINVVPLLEDTHFSWVHNETQVKSISQTIDGLMQGS